MFYNKLFHRHKRLLVSACEASNLHWNGYQSKFGSKVIVCKLHTSSFVHPAWDERLAAPECLRALKLTFNKKTKAKC